MSRLNQTNSAMAFKSVIYTNAENKIVKFSFRQSLYKFKVLCGNLKCLNFWTTLYLIWVKNNWEKYFPQFFSAKTKF